MKAVIQRVSYASVEYDDTKNQISNGIVIFLAVGKDDTEEDVDYLVKKILNLRIFENEKKKMDRSVVDIDGEILIVSEFTLYGDCSKGNRPDFTSAATAETAQKLYDKFVSKMISNMSKEKVKTGKFGAHMIVTIVNDGPVTIIINS
ncbi:MAG: D-aminoacyl-tRNA deacylase [Endomicrobia bacterium]|nr:D-aminoacyl-tRNA deacylase [Endomicrobiia bacterium]MCX7940288.1 D-aminoacyl-tRNA deacylase [Endomicrobiia bacterium]MDW8055808.1 D-aminoacyl-tRNA deacylase [Elusimicrobiota bacterium]